MDSHLHPQYHALTRPLASTMFSFMSPMTSVCRVSRRRRHPCRYYARVGKVGGIVKLDLGGKELLDGTCTALVPGLDCSACNLDVLLRHRPSSISRIGSALLAQGGARGIRAAAGWVRRPPAPKLGGTLRRWSRREAVATCERPARSPCGATPQPGTDTPSGPCDGDAESPRTRTHNGPWFRPLHRP